MTCDCARCFCGSTEISDAIDSATKPLREEVERLRAERVKIQEDSRVVTCVFCGRAYEPGTPRSNHEVLRAHVTVCEKHPAAEFRQRADQAEAEVERLKAEPWMLELTRVKVADRALVEAATAFLRVADRDTVEANNLRVALAAHKERSK